jgi:hypothetical protein
MCARARVSRRVLRVRASNRVLLLLLAASVRAVLCVRFVACVLCACHCSFGDWPCIGRLAGRYVLTQYPDGLCIVSAGSAEPSRHEPDRVPFLRRQPRKRTALLNRPCPAAAAAASSSVARPALLPTRRQCHAIVAPVEGHAMPCQAMPCNAHSKPARLWWVLLDIAAAWQRLRRARGRAWPCAQSETEQPRRRCIRAARATVRCSAVRAGGGR